MPHSHSNQVHSDIEGTRINKVGKILLGILGTLVGQFLLTAAVAFYFTRDLAKSADEFFMAVDQNNLEKAYSYLSDNLQTSQPELKQYLQQLSINDIDKTNWKSRVKRNNQGYLEGGVTTDAGDVVPIRVNFVKGEKAWKIDSIEQFAEVIPKEE